MDLLGQSTQQGLDVTAGAVQSTAVQSQVVTFMDVMAVEIGISCGIGDLHGFHGVQGLGHGCGILFFSSLGIEAEHSRHALRNGLAGDDHNLLGGQGLHLLCGHDDILVVGQDKHGFRRNLVDSLQNILGAGVHGLAAGNQSIHAQIVEHILNACTDADRDNAERLFRIRNLGSHLLLAHHLFGVLQTHVLDLRGDERAILQSCLQSQSGIVGMDMDLDDLIVVHQNQAVAQGCQISTQFLGVLVVFTGHDELGAVAEGNISIVKIREGSLLFGRCSSCIAFGGHDVLASQGRQHGFQSGQPALAAGIHNAGLFQDRVLVDGVSQSDLCFFNGSFVDKFQEVVLLSGIPCLGSSQAGDGQDGSLCGLHDSLVGCIDAFLQSVCPQNTVTFLFTLQSLGNAPQQEGEDDAGVASGAPQHGRSRGSGCLLQRRIIQLPQVCGCSVDGHGHIGTRVAVGNGEHVQFVQGLLGDLNCSGCTENHSPKVRSVNSLPQ